MIYTIGNKQNYDKLLTSGNPVYKMGREGNYEGGYVFRSLREANKYLIDNKFDNYGIYGVNADWEEDTIPFQPYNFLKADRLIVTSDLRQRK